MKRFLSVMILLCLFFRGNAQVLKIGDKLPPNLLGKEASGRLVLIDFWATWCAPCRAMIPRLDSLQRQFGKQLLVLPVAYETEKVVAPVEAAMRTVYNYQFEHEITGDTILVKLFPHRTLPHYVWISGEGIVLAITENKEVTADNVKKLLSGGNGLAEKKDIKLAYDKEKPLFVGSNGGAGETIRYQSVLSGYVPGLPASVEITPYDSLRGQRYGAHNVPFLWLARLAYGEKGRDFANSRVRILSRDSLNLNTKLSGQAYHRWLESGNGWCYELWLPPNLADKGFKYVQEDLKRLFPAYTITIDTQTVKSLVLVRTTSADKLKTTGQAYQVEIGPYAAHLRGAHLADLMLRLERQYLQTSKLPLADETGYGGKIDLDIEAPLSDLKALNAALAPYDLQFIEKLHPAELLVIKDNPIKP